MADDAQLFHLHGIRLAVPFGWEDTSLYRFNAPLPEPAKGFKRGRVLQPNVVLSRHPRRSADAPLESFFAETNAQALRENPSFHVVRSGSGRYLDQPMAWQDTAFEDPRTGAQVSQRHLLLESFPRHFTMLTVTGTAADVQRLSAEMLLGDLPQPPAELPGGGENVRAKLVHTVRADPKAKAKAKGKGR